METIGAERRIIIASDLTGEIVEKTVQRVAELMALDKESEIELVITSGGGSTISGFALHDLITCLFKPKLRTIALGEVASMAVIIFLAGAHRVITRNSNIFLHNLGRTFDKDRRLELPDLISTVEDMRHSHGTYVRIIVERSKGRLTEAQVEEMMKKATTIGPDKAVEFGLADEILG